jgi:hypothetical protein
MNQEPNLSTGGSPSQLYSSCVLRVSAGFALLLLLPLFQGVATAGTIRLVTFLSALRIANHASVVDIALVIYPGAPTSFLDFDWVLFGPWVYVRVFARKTL